MTKKEPKKTARKPKKATERKDAPRESALVRVVTPTVVIEASARHLAEGDARLLDRALMEGQRLQDVLEDTVVAFGRWLLVEVFESDTTAALDERNTNPVWLELVRRAGGPTLGVSRNLLYVALRVAAYDKRLSDESWRRLDVGRKQILLPLRDPPRLREAAQHVMKFDLTQAMTKDYVTQLLAQAGKKRQIRLTRRGLVSRVKKLRRSLGASGVIRRTEELAAKMNNKQRAEVVKEVDQLLTVLGSVSRAIKASR